MNPCCRISNRFCCSFGLITGIFIFKLLIGVAIALSTLVVSTAKAANSSPSYAIGDPRSFAKVEEEKQPEASSVPRPVTESEAAASRAVAMYRKLVVDCRLIEMGPSHDEYHQRNIADLLAQIIDPSSYAIDSIPFIGIQKGTLTAAQYKELLDKKLVQVDAPDYVSLVPNLIERNLFASDIEEIKSKLGQLNAQLMQLRANCSTLSTYMNEASIEAAKFMRKCGPRLDNLISMWHRRINNGFTNNGFTTLMRAAARGDKRIVELLLAQKAFLFTQPRFDSTTVSRKITINEQALESQMNKDKLVENLWYHSLTNKPFGQLLDGLRHSPEWLVSLADMIDPLSLATIGGHEEIVDLLLDAMISDLHYNSRGTQQDVDRIVSSIKNALTKLIMYSNLIKTNCADEFLNFFGIPEKPNLERYDAIAKKLFQATSRIFRLPDDGRYQLGSDEQMKQLLMTAMQYGTPEMLRVIAEAFAQTPVNVNWNYPFGFYAHGSRFNKIFEHFVYSLKCGEKLGILLSINAVPNSLVFQLSRGMLSYLEKNPKINTEFLYRLKGFVHEQENALIGLNGEISQMLIPDLAAIVNDYADPRRIPADIAERILAIDRPVAPKPPVEQKEREQAPSSSPVQTRMAAQLDQIKKQILIDQLTELQTIATKHKLDRAKMPILHALQLIKTQPYTKDIVALVKMLVTAIDPKPKIQYFGQPVTVNFLLEPIVSGINREINRLQHG